MSSHTTQFVTLFQAAHWLSMTEEEILDAVDECGLSGTFHSGKSVLFRADFLASDIAPIQHLTKKNANGGSDSTNIAVIKPQYKIDASGVFFAFFIWRKCWHVRPWRTTLIHVASAIHLEDAVLYCSDADIEEVRFEDLPLGIRDTAIYAER